jgi:hypothetical protein
MPLSVEILIGTVVGIGAAITLWYNIYTRWITEKSRDLEAGERNRFEYVKKQMPNLEPKLKSAVEAVKKLEKSPDSGLTSELRENLAELGKLVAEIDSIQDAHSGIVESMRKFRDRGVLFLILLGTVSLTFEIAAYLPPEMLTVALTIVLVGLFMGYGLIFYVYLRLIPTYREYKRVDKLLMEKKLDAIGVEK